MSGKIMGLVFDADLPRDQKYILLAYADHADHNGENIFPSVPLIAWKTGYSERQVQRITQELITAKILVAMGESYLGTNVYKVNTKALPQREDFRPKGRGRPPKNGDILSDELIENGDISAKNGDKKEENGDIAMSHEPSINPHIKTSNIPPAGGAREIPSSDDQPKEEKKAKGKKGNDDLFQIAMGLADVTGMDFQKNKGRLMAEAKKYYTIQDLPQIQRDYSKGGIWYSWDWRGQRGEAPSLSHIRETWGKLKAPTNTNGKATTRQSTPIASVRASVYRPV